MGPDLDGTTVVLMAYGSPQRKEEIAAYLEHIRGGERPSVEHVADLERRYDAIGGRSPLLEITRAQAAELERALVKRGRRVRVWAAMKHSPPFAAEVVREAHAEGARQFLGVALAPHFARMSIGGYERALRAAAEPLQGVKSVEMVKSWHLEPALVDAWAEAIRAIRRARPEFASPDASVLFSAHSLPARIAAEGDPYPDQLAQTCSAVAGAGEIARWSFAWQSAGQRGEWLGPPLAEALRKLAEEGARAVLSAPVGFVSDHLEVLYDLDVEARAEAERLGVEWNRAPMPNASPRLIEALVNVVERTMLVNGGA
jgi:ferrochelatase